MQEHALVLSSFEPSAILFETPAEIYARVFRALKPRTPCPKIQVDFRQFANPDSFIRLQNGVITVRISDLLEAAPAPVQEALAYILLGKLFRVAVPRIYVHRYRTFLNRRAMRHKVQVVRQIRGRKFVSGPKGQYHDLDEIFQELNRRYFNGWMGEPRLGWSQAASRTLLGHFDPSHNAIIINKLFDSAALPRIALEYVLFHEMLHLRYPVDHSRSRRRVHTREFRQAEAAFSGLQEAKEILKRL